MKGREKKEKRRGKKSNLGKKEKEKVYAAKVNFKNPSTLPERKDRILYSRNKRSDYKGTFREQFKEILEIKNRIAERNNSREKLKQVLSNIANKNTDSQSDLNFR